MSYNLKGSFKRSDLIAGTTGGLMALSAAFGYQMIQDKPAPSALSLVENDLKLAETLPAVNLEGVQSLEEARDALTTTSKLGTMWNITAQMQEMQMQQLTPLPDMPPAAIEAVECYKRNMEAIKTGRASGVNSALLPRLESCPT